MRRSSRDIKSGVALWRVADLTDPQLAFSPATAGPSTGSKGGFVGSRRKNNHAEYLARRRAGGATDARNNRDMMVEWLARRRPEARQ
jgi:hypothetical protein